MFSFATICQLTIVFNKERQSVITRIQNQLHETTSEVFRFLIICISKTTRTINSTGVAKSRSHLLKGIQQRLLLCCEQFSEAADISESERLVQAVLDTF